MYATLFAMAVVRLVLTIALATVIIRSGYRIGYRDAVSGRPARIRVPRYDDAPDDPGVPAPHIVGLLPAIGQTCNQEVSTMSAAASNPHSRTFDGTIANLSVRTLSNGQAMAVFNLADSAEPIACVVFPRLFSACAGLLVEGAPVRVSGGLETSGDHTQLVCRQIDSLA